MSEALADRWCSLLGNLADLKLRADLYRAELCRRHPAIVANGLRAVLARLLRGEPEGTRVFATLVPALAHPDADEARERLMAYVERGEPGEWEALQDVLGCHPDDAGARAIQQRTAEEIAPEGQQAGRPLTLGERKSLARRPDRRVLAQIFRDPHPKVVEILLENPALTEDRVIRIAAFRPARVGTLRAIARHPGWCAFARVRAALVQNPRTPPFLAAPLVGLLPRNVVAELLALDELYPWLRRAALRQPEAAIMRADQESEASEGANGASKSSTSAADNE